MNTGNPTGPATIDEYIEGQPKEYRALLEEIRSIILSVAPTAEQLISYQVPSFKYIYMLVGMGVTKTHCSLYIMSSALSRKLKSQPGFSGIKGTTLHFALNEPAPKELINNIVELRIAENEQIFADRQQKKSILRKSK